MRGEAIMVHAVKILDASKKPDAMLTTDVLHECHDNGLVVLKAGLYDNVIRLLPPLTISDAAQDDSARRIVDCRAGRRAGAGDIDQR